MNRFAATAACFLFAAIAMPLESVLCDAYYWKRIRLGDGTSSLHDFLLHLVLPLTLAAYLAGLGFSIAAVRATSGRRRVLVTFLSAAFLAGIPFLLLNFMEMHGDIFMPFVLCSIGVILALLFLIYSSFARRPVVGGDKSVPSRMARS